MTGLIGIRRIKDLSAEESGGKMLQSPFRQPPGKAGPAFPMDRPKEKAARMGRRFVLFNKEQQRDGKGAVGRAPIWPPDGEARARPPLFFILKGRGRQQPDVPLKQNSRPFRAAAFLAGFRRAPRCVFLCQVEVKWIR